MTGVNERWEAQQRSRWMRPDAARYLRPDIERYFAPAAWQAMTPAQRGQPSGAEIERKEHVVTERSVEDLQRERRWLARQKLELLELYDLHLRLKAQLYSEKYSPNQPRVPKGNPDGGQWTNYGGGSGRGGRVQVADLRSGRGRINDRRVISDADPDPLLNGPTASRYKDPNDPLGLNKWRLEHGGGGGRSGYGSSPPSYSRGGGAASKPASSAQGDATKAAIEALAKENPLFRAGLNRYRNSDLTEAGRALTKHPEVIGATKDTLRKTLRSDGSVNDAAHTALADIMRNGVTTTLYRQRFGQVIDIRIPGGFGARWYANGKFITFLNPRR